MLYEVKFKVDFVFSGWTNFGKIKIEKTKKNG